MEDETAKELMRQWQAQMQASAVAASQIDWSQVKVDPKDVSFQMGPMLTEEQFKSYCAETGLKPNIIKKKEEEKE